MIMPNEKNLKNRLFEVNGVWWLPEGEYGAIGMTHGNSRGKNGYRLYGVFTYENRFPKNENAITLIRKHGGFFLREQKQWFIPNCSTLKSTSLSDSMIQLASIGYEIDAEHKEHGNNSRSSWPFGPLYKGSVFKITKYGNLRLNWF